jgi:1,4-alpha-glucan branching enzyme
MPGDYEQKFAGVRGFVSYMMAHPGKKLMFMGGEIGQFDEWNANEQLQWNLLEYEKHRQLNHFFAEANKFYRDTPAMHENDYDWNGFQWVALDDYQKSVIAFRRIAYDGSEVLCVCNFQPVQRDNYRVGVPVYGIYEEVFNSESAEFGGCGVVNSGDIKSDEVKDHEMPYSIEITLPPLGVMYFKLKEKLALPKPKKSTSKMAAKKKAAAAKSKTEKAEKPAEEKSAPKAKKPAKAEESKAEKPKKATAKKAEPKAEKPAEE